MVPRLHVTPCTVVVNIFDPFYRGVEEASWSEGKHRTQLQKFSLRFKTLSHNPHGPAVSLKQFNF